ncbi:MAG: hypothetical protein HC877_23430 [Thioploca sp.]|nr:hypothetical protein [Thioploca sp.]
MGFTNQERINLNSKILAASVKDANEIGQWYESFYPNEFISKGNKIWINPDLDTLLLYPAANLAQAQANASGILSNILEDRSSLIDAVRLTPVPGTNGSTYVAYLVYNDFTSARLDNWVQPQIVPQLNGQPSFGYSIRLFNGDPNFGGTEVFTTDGTTGTGINKTVGWVFDYANGMLLLSEDFRTNVPDPWIVGFRYVGTTALDGYNVGSETIYTSLVYQPGGMKNTNVFTNWNELYVELSKTQGFRTIVFDDTFTLPIIPAGTYNLKGVKMQGLLRDPQSPVTVLLDDGVIFSEFPRFNNFINF